MKTFKFKFLLSLSFILTSFLVYSQCGVNVPVVIVDLTGAPDSTWVLQEVDAPDRNGQCCGASPSNNCIRFEITLDANCAGVYLDYDGAPGLGSLDWQVNCGPEHDLRDTICLSGPGSYSLTFCKPGTDNGNYSLVSVPKPTFPDDQTVPMNCVQPMEVLGITSTQIQWTSISPGSPGDYDYMLDCTDCLTPTFTPDPNGPTFVEYRICGYPLMDQCVGAFEFCDTVAITVQDSLKVFVNPENATFCSGGNAIINASATGGDGNYSFYWYNSSLSQVGTGTTFSTNISGTYTVEVRDGNWEQGSCDGFFKTFTVSEVQPPQVNAGDDQVLCADSPVANLVGTMSGAQTVIWTGGSGVYTPSNTSLSLSYTPTQTEINNGFVTLTLTSNGAGGGCVEESDNITLFFVDTIKTDLTDFSLNCNNSSILINPVVTGGLAPLTFLWSDGSTNSSNTLGGGTHCLSILDGNGCVAMDCFTISVPNSLVVGMSSTPATTVGGTDGTATASPIGGTSPYNYAWNSGGNSSTETGLGYGIYTVVVTDDNGCQANGSVVVNDPVCGGFFASVNQTSVQCFGGADGSATVVLTGGTSPYTYLWDDAGSQNSSTASGLTAGVYSVTVTDDNGCFAIGSTVVIEPTQIQNTFTHTDVSIQGGNDGSAQANVSGGAGTYSYVWSNSSTSLSITGLSNGWYSVTISDVNGCQLVDSLHINEPPCNLFDITVGTTPVLCNGQSNGEAIVNILNGNGSYTIDWSSGQTNVTSVNGLAAGIYTVEVTDALNCYAFSTFGIAEPSVLSMGMVSAPSTCFGEDNGTIDLTVSGGTFPIYNFLWDNGLTQEDRISLAPGSYSVTVTDNNGCAINGSVDVQEPDSMIVAVTQTNVTCFEGTDGSINVVASGGTGVYNYDWSNGASSQNLSGLDVGGYLLTLTDGNACGLTEPVYVTITQPEIVDFDTVMISCPTSGQTTTNVEVIPIGGVANYLISFDGGANYLSSGDYQEMLTIGQSYNLLIQDVNGCLSDAYLFDIDTAVYASSIIYDLCFVAPQTQETIQVIPAGGSADYSISIDNGVTFYPVLDYDILVDINASYQLVVLDSKGCYSKTYNVSLPDTMYAEANILSNYNGSDISCFGFSDGEVEVVVSGGGAPYTYSWNNGESTAQITSLSAGTYSVTILDTNNCQINTDVTLTEPAQITSNVIVTSDYNGEEISCNGLADGTALVSGAGGVQPYSYLWSNAQITAQATGLSSDTYTVEITDANGCTTDNSIFISEPDTIEVTTQITDVSCNGGNDGAIDITVIGGVNPYTFLWSNGATTQNISSLSAGTFQVSVMDLNNCTYILDEIVVDPTLIDLELIVNHISCFGFADGSLDLTTSGGALPHTILWSNGETSEDISNLDIGNYVATVTDGNGCWTDISGTVTQPDSLWAILTPFVYFHGHHVSDHGQSDGSIDVAVNGGTNPFSFDWSNGENTQNISGLGAGEYILEITDSNGCFYSSSVILTEPYALQIPTGITPNGDGKNDALFIRGLEVYPNSSVVIINQWGNVVWETANYQNDWQGTNKNGGDLPDGTYFVILTLQNGEKYNSYLDLRRN